MSDDPVRLFLPSASSFAADVVCAGRQNMLRQMRDQNIPAADESATDEYSERGTRLHDAWASENTLPLKDEGELSAYKKACEIEATIIEQWQRDNDIAVVPEPIVEERLWLHNTDTGAPVLSGALDRIYIVGRHGLLLDLKSGTTEYVGAVNANWQVRVYSALAKNEWPQLKRIRAAFIKPEAFGPRFDCVNFTETDLAHIEQAIRHALWKSSLPDASRQAGVHCRFCPARAICPEAAKYAMTAIYALPPTPTNGELSKKRILELVSTMPLESALSVWQKRGVMKAIMDAISARLAAATGEHERLGLKLTDGRKSEFVKDVRGAFDAMKESGFTEEELWRALSMNKGDVLTVIQNRLMCSGPDAEKYYESQLDAFIERGRGNPSLVEK